ncbi:heterokaryon incompatibility protein-domain-containing protein [Xylaria arbuscula]|nr:heterokaryon incompatibility protein-domain-containing protein [Xylaria arbuscula]
MGDTYTRCTRCLVWLGMPPADVTATDAENAFDIIRYLAAAGQADDMDSIPLPSAIANDLQAFNRAINALHAVVHPRNPWWKRVWTVQEAALPGEVHLHFGKATLPWDIVMAAVRTWTEKGSPQLLEQRLPYERLDYINALVVHSVWINVARARYDNPLEAMIRWRFRLATDVRDKAFGLFGLLPSGCLPRTEECRYDIPRADVLSCMTVEVILSEGGLRALAANPRLEAYKATPGIPRWAIDLSAFPDHDLDWYYQCYGYDAYNADDGLDPLDLDVVSTCVSEKTLKLKGIRIGSVKCVEEGIRRFRNGSNSAPIALGETIQKWFDRVEGKANKSEVVVPDPYPAGYPRSEAFARLMLGDAIRNYNQVPLNEAVNEYFTDVWTLMNSREVAPNIHLTVLGMLSNQALIVTETGLIGSALIDTELGDEVWVFGGGKVPFTLRPRDNDHSTEYNFVGKCYVQGIMQGEAFANDGYLQKQAEQTIVIR